MIAEALGFVVIVLGVQWILGVRERRAWERAKGLTLARLQVRIFDWLYHLYAALKGTPGLPSEYANDARRFASLLDDAATRPESIAGNRLLCEKLKYLVQENLTRLARFLPVSSKEPELAALLLRLEDDVWRWDTFFLYRDANLSRDTDTWQFDAVSGCLRSVNELVHVLWPEGAVPLAAHPGRAAVDANMR